MGSSDISDELDGWEVIPSPYELRGEEEDPGALVRETSYDESGLSPGAGSSASCSASFESDDQGSEQPSQPDSPPRITVQMGRQMRLVITSLSKRIASATSWFWFWPCSACRAKAWSLSSVTVFMAAVAFALACAKMTRWHKQAMDESKRRLLVVLREQEEKISKLLGHIAQMNDILSARHKQAMEESKRKLLFLFREQEETITKILVQLAQTNEILSARRRVPVLHTC